MRLQLEARSLFCLDGTWFACGTPWRLALKPSLLQTVVPWGPYQSWSPHCMRGRAVGLVCKSRPDHPCHFRLPEEIQAHLAPLRSPRPSRQRLEASVRRTSSSIVRHWSCVPPDGTLKHYISVQVYGVHDKQSKRRTPSQASNKRRHAVLAHATQTH